MAPRAARLPPAVQPYVEPTLDPAPDGLSAYDDEAEALVIAQLRALGAAAPWVPDALCRRLGAAWGQRLTAKLRARVEALAPAAGLVRDGDSFWPEAGPRAATAVGWRRSDPALPAPRAAGELPMSERRAALAWLLAQGVDLPVDDLLRAAGREFGFAQLGRQVREALDEALDALAADGQAVVADGRATLPGGA